MCHMTVDRQRVLVVEDDEAIARMLEIELADAGYDVVCVGRGDEAVAAIARDQPAAVVLDLRLPDRDGLSVCRQARREGFGQPILMLTALDRLGDRVLGLDAGADDYLAKPFAIEELLARLRALLRRTTSRPRTLAAGPVRLDPETHEVTVDGRLVELTAREFDLLAFLMRAPGRVYTREQIFEAVWGYDYLGDSKVIDVFISALRRKLDSNPEQSIVRTVRGVGYTIRP
jgi:two-component system, OmpR family, response regulator MprA